MFERLGPILWTVSVLLGVYCVQTLWRWRWMRLRQYRDLPQFGKPSLIWGHMAALNDQIKEGDPRRHIDHVALEVIRKHGNPPLLFVDLRPIDYPWLFIGSHEVAEQISKASSKWQSSAPKAPGLGIVWPLTGRNSVLTAEGEEWKQQRRRLNPGFAPQHLLTTLPAILDKARLFLGHLDRSAVSGDEVSLNTLITNLTFDVIGAVTMGLDFNAQIPGEESEVMLGFTAILADFPKVFRPLIPGTKWFVERNRRRLAAKVEALMKDIVRNEYASVTSAGHAHRSRSVLGLSLQGTEELTPELLQQTSDNLRVFMFAGHDTTSILLQWAFYELSRSPTQRRALAAELDELFGADADPEAVRARLLAPGGAELLNSMTYTSAVIKETLRHHPPASTVRMAPPGANFQLALPGGKQICADGMVMYVNAFMIQHDRGVWGETADDWAPERWLGDTSWMPPGAYRPFERGPRSCIGLELANIEAKVVLALVARRYDFVKVGIGELDLDGDGRPVVDDKGYYRTKSQLFSSIQVTAKPVDGMMCKVKTSGRASKA